MTPRTYAALVRIALRAIRAYEATGIGLQECREALETLEQGLPRPTQEHVIEARQAMERVRAEGR